MSKGRSLLVERRFGRIAFIQYGVIALLLLACGVALLPRLQQQTLFAGRQALLSCLHPTEPLPDSPDPFFTAAVLQCRGLDATSAWIDAITASADRLSVIRAVRPNDTALAQLATAEHPANALAYQWLGESLTTAGDANGAAAALERAMILQGTDDAELWLKLGTAYDHAHNPTDAARAYDQACRLFDRGANGCVRAGYMYMELADYPTALARFEQSTAQLAKYDVFYGPTAFGLAQALIALDRPAEALPYLQRLAAEGHGQAAQLLDQLQTTP
jgi:tetratricopeptide (TPR) repeat protein